MTPAASWGSGSTTTQDHTLRRKAAVSTGDSNASNTFDPGLEWDGYPVDTFAGLGSHSATCTQPELLINELDSDTQGADTAEFVELFDGGAGNTPLDGLAVVFFNGDDDRSYAAFDLDGLATNAAGYFVLGNASLTPGLTVPRRLAAERCRRGRTLRRQRRRLPARHAGDHSQSAGRTGLRHRRCRRSWAAGLAQSRPAAG